MCAQALALEPASSSCLSRATPAAPAASTGCGTRNQAATAHLAARLFSQALRNSSHASRRRGDHRLVARLRMLLQHLMVCSFA